MNNYKKIKIDHFERAMYYDYFMSVGTTLDVTSKVDVTHALKKCKKEALSFYGYSIYCLTKVVNSIENMRYDLLDDELILWDKITPSFTSFNEQTKLFHALWIECEGDYLNFDKEFKALVEHYKNANHISPISNEPANLFNISTIPWLAFESISANNKFSPVTLHPMISTGKYQEIQGKISMPVNLKVHHATMDGYHIALFFEKLQNELNQ
ncbi:CatA-like O-acetyltransferase [Vagococcus sp.]|uniref:CatA-like O-acetyltransferase n=1 Tax=Vagococcus sp. TaxID=1933889 RepID=UPI003F97143C